MTVAVVTDSTASLPAALADAAGVVVVPLQVTVDGTAHREGVDLGTAGVVEALRRGARMTTSQPGPDAFARTYARLAARGAREIVSVHLSSELSGTVASAQLAARSTGVPVHVVDSRSVAMGLGYAVLAAARETSGSAAVRAAERTAAGSQVLFAVDSLEHLRRGGRLGPVAAALGTVLGLRPVLGVRHGRLEVVDKVRTGARARDRVVEATLEEARRRRRCVVAVHHLDRPDLAAQVAERIRGAAADSVRDVHVAEVSAVLGVHVGPGLLATVVSDA